MGLILQFVLGNIFSQGMLNLFVMEIICYFRELLKSDTFILPIFPVNLGQHFASAKLNIRLAAGAWCVGCFFLVQIYCSTLTSHLTAPNERPIVNSFFEIADAPGVRLTFDRGMGIDAMLQQVDR